MVALFDHFDYEGSSFIGIYDSEVTAMKAWDRYVAELRQFHGRPVIVEVKLNDEPKTYC